MFQITNGSYFHFIFVFHFAWLVVSQFVEICKLKQAKLIDFSKQMIHY